MCEFVCFLVILSIAIAFFIAVILVKVQKQAIFRKDLKSDRVKFFSETFGLFDEFNKFHFDGEYFYLPRGPQYPYFPIGLMYLYLPKVPRHFSLVARITLVESKKVVIAKEMAKDLPHTITYKYYTTSGNVSRRMDRRNPQTPHSLRCVFHFEGKKPCNMIIFISPDSHANLERINQFLKIASKYDLEECFREYETAFNNLKKYQNDYDSAVKRKDEIDAALSASIRLSEQKKITDKIREEQKKISTKIEELEMKVSTAKSDKSKIIQKVKDLEQKVKDLEAIKIFEEKN